MNLYQEIAEGRMLRTLANVHGLSTTDLAERVFEHMLGLQLLVQEHPTAAKKYAAQIVQAQTFNGFRANQTDLYNFLVLLMRPEQYERHVKKNLSIVMPEFIIRRNIRAIAAGKFDLQEFNRMMLLLQRRFPDLTARQINLRREISNYATLSKNSRKNIISQLLFAMQERRHWINSDLYVLLHELK
jgi:hypothetical protein